MSISAIVAKRCEIEPKLLLTT